MTRAVAPEARFRRETAVILMTSGAGSVYKERS